MRGKWMKLRWSAVILGMLNMVVLILGIIFIKNIDDDDDKQQCSKTDIIPILGIWVVCFVRLIAMVPTAIAQRATALLVVSQTTNTPPVSDALVRHQKRLRYKRWLWWSRASMFVTFFQFIGAIYLVFRLVFQPTPMCQNHLLLFMTVVVCLLVVLQCLAGSDVFRWRSFYTTQDHAWKTHYHQVFDYALREALCCMGRSKYL